MKKIFIFAGLIMALSLLITGCGQAQPKPTAQTPTAQTQISYLEPTKDPLKFCNGADMDSAGFRKTITQKMTASIPKDNLSKDQLIIETLIYASSHTDFQTSHNVDANTIKIIGDTAYIQPIEGWAGVSIFLCYWKPFIEVNLLQFPEIKKVVWVTDQVQWENLK